MTAKHRYFSGLDEPPYQLLAGWPNQKNKTQRVRDKSRCEQKRAADSQEQPFHDFLTRQFSTVQALLGAGDRGKTLLSQDLDANGCRQHHKNCRVESADMVCNFKKQQHLENRNSDKNQK